MDFNSESLFDLVDTLYRRSHGLTASRNHLLRDLVDRERLRPAIVRRPPMPAATATHQ